MTYFTIRQLLLVVIWLTLVLAAFVGSGSYYATALGVLAAPTLYFGNRLFTQWRKRPSGEITLIALALAVSMLATAFGTSMMIDDARSLARMSQELQSEIHADPRFTDVTAYFSGVRHSLVLNVGGHVASQQDYSALQSMADDNFWHFKTTIKWRVAISTNQRRSAKSGSRERYHSQSPHHLAIQQRAVRRRGASSL